MQPQKNGKGESRSFPHNFDGYFHLLIPLMAEHSNVEPLSQCQRSSIRRTALRVSHSDFGCADIDANV